MSLLKDRLREALDDSGKSQTELAKACGVKTPSVSDWLSGKTKKMKTACAIRAAAFLNVNLLWLTEGIGGKSPDGSVTYVTRVLPSPNFAAREHATQYVARGITYEVVKAVVTGALDGMGLRYDDLVEDEDAARNRVESALEESVGKQRPAPRHARAKAHPGKVVRTMKGMVRSKLRTDSSRKKKPA